MRKRYDSLPKKEQIKKLKQENKFLVVFGICFSIFMIALIIYLFTQTDQIKLAVGFTIALPISIWLGGFVQIRINNEKIKTLEKEIWQENKEQCGKT